MNKTRKKLCIHFDKLLNNSELDPNSLKLPPMQEGINDFLSELALNYDIYIFSQINSTAVQKWLTQNNLAKYIKDITNKDIQAYAYIDTTGLKYNS